MWSDEQLGDEFHRQMNLLTERQHSDWTHESKWFSLTAWLSKLFWTYLGIYCQIDLYGGLQTYTPNVWNWRYRENFDRRYSTINRFRWWGYVSLVLCLVGSARIANNMYFQYTYDFNFLRYEVLQALTMHENRVDVSGQLKSNIESPYIHYIRMHEAARAIGRDTEPNANNNPASRRRPQLPAGLVIDPLAFGNLTEIGAQLKKTVASARRDLKMLGAPYINMHFIVEITYYFMCSGALVLVVVLRSFYRYLEPFNFSLTRAFLDLKHERRLTNRLIIDEINKFIASSRNFTHTCIEQIRLYAKEHVWAGGEREPKGERVCVEPNIMAEMKKLRVTHTLLAKQLKQMALNGFLLPYHRTPKWVDSVSILTMLLNLLTMGYGLIGTLFFAFIFIALSDDMDMEFSMLDILVIVEAGVLVAFIIPIGVFFISQIIANCVDQIYYSVDICRHIGETIRSNQARFRQLLRLQRETDRLLADWRLRLEGAALKGLRGRQNLDELDKLAGDDVDGELMLKCCPRQWHSILDMHANESKSDEHSEANGRQSNSNNLPFVAPPDSSESSAGCEKPCRHAHSVSLPSSSESSPSSCSMCSKKLRWPMRSPAGRAECANSDSVKRSVSMWRESSSLRDTSGKRADSSSVRGRALRRRSVMNCALAMQSCRTQMNSELLKVFMHYKIFVAQVKPVTNSFGTFAPCLLLLMLVSPINVRMHSPYLNQEKRIYTMLFNLLFATIVDLCFVPMCYMYSRCLNLYKQLSSLLAHVIEVSVEYRQQRASSWQPSSSDSGPRVFVSANQWAKRELQFQSSVRVETSLAARHIQSAVNGHELYDAHTVWLLRKELNHPHQMASQFAIFAYTMRLTYSSLLRVHFWVGLITLSMVVDASTSQEFFGRLFNDPFGIFNWPPAAMRYMVARRHASAQ